MKCEQKLRLIIVPLVLMILHCQAESKTPTKPYHKALTPYIDFLKNNDLDPVDYAMGLFKKYDIVILCERAHPEITQYDLIYRLVSDRRFIDEVGHVFTELGSINQGEKIDAYLKSENLDAREAENNLLYIYRNLTFLPMWNNVNFYEFLKKLRLLNMFLPPEKKISLYFSDVPFSWEDMTEDNYREFQSTLSQRDRMMADNVIRRFSEIRRSAEARKKALVIMNYRHAFNDRFEKPGGKKGDNVGRYVFEAFPDKTANVLLNSVRILLGSTDQNVIMAPIQDGKWDAAFAVMGNSSIGFDMESSPFGQDEFDFFPVRNDGLTYQDVFTGFVFYKPLEQHKFLTGIQGLFANGFDHVAVSRYVKTGMTEQDARKHVEESGQPKESCYDDIGEFKRKIRKWIDPGK